MNPLIVRQFNSLQDYSYILKRMQEFTNERTPETPDEIWLLEHKPIYTMGLAGKDQHIIKKLPHPVVKCDRGGQITYHGPGQLICYFMIDLKKARLSIIDLIDNIEKIIILTLSDIGIIAEQNHAIGRGVFIGTKKIASIGIRVKKYKSYHGFSLNYSVDLSSFQYINPCGHANLRLTNINDYLNNFTKAEINTKITTHCRKIFNYDSLNNCTEEQ
jgi:lipoyl(octanoyl) transferase